MKNSNLIKKSSVRYALFFIILIILSSCTARKNAMKFATNQKDARTKIEDQVRLVKNSALANDKKENLKKEYEAITKSFNDTYDGVIKKLKESPVSQGECAVLTYGAVIKHQEENLKKSAQLGEQFLSNSNKALNPVGANVGIIGILESIKEILVILADENLRYCEQKIEDLKYKAWEDIK